MDLEENQENDSSQNNKGLNVNAKEFSPKDPKNLEMMIHQVWKTDIGNSYLRSLSEAQNLMPNWDPKDPNLTEGELLASSIQDIVNRKYFPKNRNQPPLTFVSEGITNFLNSRTLEDTSFEFSSDSLSSSSSRQILHPDIFFPFYHQLELNETQSEASEASEPEEEKKISSNNSNIDDRKEFKELEEIDLEEMEKMIQEEEEDWILDKNDFERSSFGLNYKQKINHNEFFN